MKLFTAEEEKYLQKMLSKQSEDAPVVYLEELHGLLFGLAITPEEIPLEEWLPLIINDETVCEDEQEMETMIKHLANAYDRMYKANLKGKLMFPFDYDRMKDDDFDLVEDWVYGLFMAISFRPDIWTLGEEEIDQETFDQLPEETRAVLDAFTTIAAIAVPDQMESAFDSIAEEEGIDKDDLFGTFLNELPDCVETLIEHGADMRKKKSGPKASAKRRSVQKRKKENDGLCPCGSGREYKKCCGAH